MNIFVASQYFQPEQFRVNDICLELTKMGHSVTVLTGLPNYPSGSIPKEYKWGKNRKETLGGIKVIRSWLIPRGKGKLKLSLNYLSFAVSASLKALFMNKNFDLILCFQTSPITMALPAIVMKHRTKKPFILYCQDQWPASLSAMNITEGSTVYKILTPVSRYIYKKADALLIGSSMFEEYFSRVHGISGNITYLPIYSETLFEAVKETPKEKETYDFVFAGNVGYVQGVETIIQAAKLVEQNTKIRFHIVGGGSALESVKSLAKELQLNNVVFYGQLPIERMPEFYSMADAMLVTLNDDSTITNTLPGKVQTYMAAGKPIIAAINGETQRVIENANCGLCCNSLDAGSLAEKIEEFIKEQDKNKKYGENAKRFYEENFSKQIFFDTLMEICDAYRKRGKKDV